ncbi:MAG: hypothetical protein JXR10_17920 [Cyclobacteriaceae bacterium]
MKIDEYSTLPKLDPANMYYLDFHFADLTNWELIEPDPNFGNYQFYNLAYWFLGYGEGDSNYADESLIVLTDKESGKPQFVGVVGFQTDISTDAILIIKNSGERYIMDVPSIGTTQIDSDSTFDINEFLNERRLVERNFHSIRKETASMAFFVEQVDNIR